MTESRRKGRRSPARAFRPTVDGRLEARELLSGFTSPFGKNYRAESAYLLKHPSARAAKNLKAPPQFAHTAPHFNNIRGFHQIRYIGTQTARGGQNVEVTALDGSHYMVSLSYTSNTLATNSAEGANGQSGAATSTAAAQQVTQQSASYPQPIGTVRAYPMSGGRVGIIVDGSTQNTELTINPLGEPQRKGFAHSFAYGESARNHILNVGQITVTSGAIASVLGFQDTVLSGPLTVTGTTAIDRIAFNAILPGASITTGGDVNTLDVLNGISLSGAGTGISIGRDLNLLNVGGNLQLSSGATFTVGRDFGLLPQPPKGTGTGSNVLLLNFNTLTGTTITTALPPSVGSLIQGSVIVNPGSVFSIGGIINNTLYVEGSVTAGFTPVSSTFTLGTLSRLTILNGTPAFLLQRILEQFGTMAAAPDSEGYVTALGGFA